MGLFDGGKHIQGEDSMLFPVDSAKIFPVLLDLHAYPDWWPRSIHFQVDPGPVRAGTKMRISNQGLVRWTAEVTGIQEGRKIAFRYFDGAWDGTAAWTLTPEGSGTRVAYSIDIVPVPLWLRVLARLLDLGKIHSKMMGGIFRSLKEKLG